MDFIIQRSCFVLKSPVNANNYRKNVYSEGIPFGFFLWGECFMEVKVQLVQSVDLTMLASGAYSRQYFMSVGLESAVYSDNYSMRLRFCSQL